MSPSTPPTTPKVRIDVDGQQGSKATPIRRTSYTQGRLRMPTGRRDRGHPQQRSRRRGGPKAWLFGLFGLVVVIVAAMLLYGWFQWNRVPDAEGVDALPAPAGVETIVMAGTDSREGLTQDQLNQMGDDAGTRADTLMAVVLPPGHAKSTLLSIPRDLRVDVPGRGIGKINGALNGGPATLVAAVQEATGLTVNHYVEVHFNGFQDLSTALGGVPICVDHPMRDLLSQLDIPAGCQDLEGPQALAYVRSRHAEFLIDGQWVADPQSDLARIARQQQFMQAMLKKMANPASVFRIPAIADAAKKTFTVDPQFSYWHLLRLGLRFIPSPSARLQYATLPVTPETISGVSYVTPEQPQADQLLTALRNGEEPPSDLLSDPAEQEQKN